MKSKIFLFAVVFSLLLPASFASARTFHSWGQGQWNDAATWSIDGGQVPGVDYPDATQDAHITYSALVTLVQDEASHDVVFDGDQDQLAGSLDLAGKLLSVFGNWKNYNNLPLVSNGGAVYFNSSSTQFIFGTTTFENLIVTATSARTVSFAPGSKTTATESLVLEGSPDNLLSLVGDASKAVPQFLKKWGSFRERARLSSPYAVAVDASGNFYVADGNADRVVKFNPAGSSTAIFRGDTTIFRPDSITIHNGLLYVVDGDRMVVLNSDGTFSAEYNGGAPETFSQIEQVSFDATGSMYIADVYNNRVVILNPDGTPSHVYDGTEASISFDQVSGVTVDAEGKIYVADSYNHRVVVLNPDGTASSSIEFGEGFPTHLEIGLDGSLYVLDVIQSNISVYDQGGILTHTYSGEAFPSVTNFTLDEAHGLIYITNSGEDPNNVISINLNGDIQNTFTAVTLGQDPMQYAHPTGLAYDSSGNIYVSDKVYGPGDRIEKFDSAGSYVSFFGSYGSDKGQFIATGYMAIDSQNNIYATDLENHRVQKFDSNGDFLLTFGWGVKTGAEEFEICTESDVSCQSGITGLGDGQFSWSLNDLAVDSSDNVYIVDTDNHRIQKFDSSGNYIGKWGTEGSGDGQFYQPIDIEINPHGDIYVTDVGNRRINKFDSNGDFLLTFGWGVKDGDEEFQICMESCQEGNGGSGDGQLGGGVGGLAIDSSGNLYISDYGNNRIQKFDSSEHFLAKWGTEGSGDGQFYGLMEQIMVDASGNIYVTDVGNNRIQVFSQSSDAAWFLDAPANTTASYLYVSNSHNTGSPISCANCVDGGGNTGWNFASETPVVPEQTSRSGGHRRNPTSSSSQQQGQSQNSSSNQGVSQQGSSPTPRFENSLRTGSSGATVKTLQAFLNAQGFIVSTTGAGSPGNESSYFGTKTKNALIKFQEAHAKEILWPLGLTKGTGILGPSTIQFINSLLKN